MENEKFNKDIILREELALQRTIMAQYRTLLAFLRTALYFPVAGISMHKALTLSYGIYLQWSGISIGVIILIFGFIYQIRSSRKVNQFRKYIGNHPGVAVTE